MHKEYVGFKIYLTKKGFIYLKTEGERYHSENWDDIEIYDGYNPKEEIPNILANVKAELANFHEHPFYTYKKNELRIAALEEKLSEIARIFSK